MAFDHQSELIDAKSSVNGDAIESDTDDEAATVDDDMSNDAGAFVFVDSIK